MLRLPDGWTWPQLGCLVGTLVAGVYVAGEVKERRETIASLESYAAAKPERAEIARMLADCNRRPIVDYQACSAQLLAKFGPGVLDTMALMAAEGAFGDPN